MSSVAPALPAPLNKLNQLDNGLLDSIDDVLSAGHKALQVNGSIAAEGSSNIARVEVLNGDNITIYDIDAPQDLAQTFTVRVGHGTPTSGSVRIEVWDNSTGTPRLVHRWEAHAGDPTLLCNGDVGQISVGARTALHASAAFGVLSARGCLLSPMTTTERQALTPADGLIVYDTTLHKLFVAENGSWVQK